MGDRSPKDKQKKKKQHDKHVQDINQARQQKQHRREDQGLNQGSPQATGQPDHKKAS